MNVLSQSCEQEAIKEIGDYLVANGYEEITGTTPGVSTYLKDDIGIVLHEHFLDIMKFHASGAKGSYESILLVKDVRQMNTVNLMLILHATGAVRIKDFLKNLQNEGTIVLDIDIDTLVPPFEITVDTK